MPVPPAARAIAASPSVGVVRSRGADAVRDPMSKAADRWRGKSPGLPDRPARHPSAVMGLRPATGAPVRRRIHQLQAWARSREGRGGSSERPGRKSPPLSFAERAVAQEVLRLDARVAVPPADQRRPGARLRLGGRLGTTTRACARAAPGRRDLARGGGIGLTMPAEQDGRLRSNAPMRVEGLQFVPGAALLNSARRCRCQAYRSLGGAPSVGDSTGEGALGGSAILALFPIGDRRRRRTSGGVLHVPRFVIVQDPAVPAS